MKGKSGLLIFLFLLIATINCWSQNANPPKIIVVLVIDELDNEQLNLVQPSLSENGFKRISRQGFRFMSVSSSDISGYPGTQMASLFSGTTPSVHGLVGERWFDYKTSKHTEAAKNDSTSLHNALFYSYSKSLADYLKSFYGPSSRSAAITINAPWMIHSLGYNPDLFFSFDLNNGIFKNNLTSKTPDNWHLSFNKTLSSTNFLQRQWGPTNDITTYTEYKYLDKNKKQDFRSFLYNMNGNGDNAPRFNRLAGSPYANTLLRDFTVAFLASTDFGKNGTPDLLTITFTAKPYIKTNGVILPAEKEDLILRMDNDIASLIDFLDVEYGKNNYLIMLTAAANSAADATTAGKRGVTTGIVEYPKISALLNLYIMAIHGQGRWVLDINDSFVYLNRKMIEEKGLSINEIQELAALFLLDVSGIDRALPLHNIYFESNTEHILSLNLFPNRSGDIYITLKQGWQTTATANGTRQTGNSGQQVKPLILRGWNVSEGAWMQNVPQNQIIPIVLHQLGIYHPAAINSTNIPVFKK
jgi:hypothetical protein